MKSSKSTPMTRQAASRIASVASRQNHGQIPPRSFASRADATAQRQAASQGNKKG
jgi:hypothetical protein